MNRVLLTYRKLRKKIEAKKILKIKDWKKLYSDLKISENSKQDEHTHTHSLIYTLKHNKINYNKITENQ